MSAPRFPRRQRRRREATDLVRKYLAPGRLDELQAKHGKGWVRPAMSEVQRVINAEIARREQARSAGQ